MYQLSRLLHDYHRDLYNHLEEFEIGPSLYAAPWFLTMFASQFPLGFVARVFGKLWKQHVDFVILLWLADDKWQNFGWKYNKLMVAAGKNNNHLFYLFVIHRFVYVTSLLL